MQGVSKAIFKGVMELLKYLMLCIEEELEKEPESSTFSIFLIFRIAFSIYLPPKPQKPTIGISLLNALNLNSFVTSPNPPADPEPSSDTPKRSKKDKKELAGSHLPTISISDTDEETEELHILHKCKSRSRRGSSPLLVQKRAINETTAMPARAHSLDFPLAKSETVHLESITTLTDISEASTTSSTELDGRSSDLKPTNHESPSVSSPQMNKINVETSSLQPTPTVDNSISPTELSSMPGNKQPSSDQDSLLSISPRLQTLSSRLSPLEGSVPPSPQRSPSSPDPRHQLTGRTPINKALILSELINSPRFYHPREGQDLTGCTFLYKELMKSLGNSREFMLSRHFWNQTFISTLTVDRENLGWNEWTVSLYKK